MPFLTNKTESNLVDIYFKDYGSGQPVILIHGWPLSHRSWEQQIWAIVEAGYRCIAYDRRGFGHSTAPWDGYDYDTLAGDLNQIITQLELEDVVLVGFSMGGGEVVRYCSKYGTDKIDKIALVSSIIPLVAQKENNPNGVPQEDLRTIIEELQKDRVGFLKQFHPQFYNYNILEDGVSQAQLDYDWNIASEASPRATIQTAKSWSETDFRDELIKVDVPCLVIHGDSDQIVPRETSADQAAAKIAGSRLEIIKDAPHGLHLTHADSLNSLLLDFFENAEVIRATEAATA